MIHLLAAHGTSISVAFNILVAPALVWMLVSLRSSGAKLSCSERALSEMTQQLASERKEHARDSEALKEANEFIAALKPLFRAAAGDAADYGARYLYWEKKAFLLWEHIRELSAAKQREAKLDLGYKIVEAILSYFVPHRKPAFT
jgi:hypothetical protein